MTGQEWLTWKLDIYLDSLLQKIRKTKQKKNQKEGKHESYGLKEKDVPSEESSLKSFLLEITASARDHRQQPVPTKEWPKSDLRYKIHVWVMSDQTGVDEIP